MSESIAETPDNVVPLHGGEWRPRTERINGIKIHLGRMTNAQLMDLEAHTRIRVSEAQTDLWIIQDYRERLYGSQDNQST